VQLPKPLQLVAKVALVLVAKVALVVMVVLQPVQ
jgi:hypothetical protein